MTVNLFSQPGTGTKQRSSGCSHQLQLAIFHSWQGFSKRVDLVGISCSSVGVTERKRGQGEAFSAPETPGTVRCKVPKLKLGQLVKDHPQKTPAGSPMCSFPSMEMTPGLF